MRQVYLATVVAPSLFTLYWIIINIATFLKFWVDKRRAESNLRRIPERKLLIFAFLGGSLGALLAQQLFRHKTRKQPFRSRLIMIAVFHTILAGVFVFPMVRTIVFNLISKI